MGIPFPEEYGGAGGDSLAYALVVEELTRVDLSSDYDYIDIEDDSAPDTDGGVRAASAVAAELDTEDTIDVELEERAA